jgi:hypothetical protein
MVIESRKLLGGVAALAAVGAVAWVSMFAFTPLRHGTVEVQQLNAPSWAVEVKELGLASVPGDGSQGNVQR